MYTHSLSFCYLLTTSRFLSVLLEVIRSLLSFRSSVAVRIILFLIKGRMIMIAWRIEFNTSKEEKNPADNEEKEREGEITSNANACDYNTNFFCFIRWKNFIWPFPVFDYSPSYLIPYQVKALFNVRVDERYLSSTNDEISSSSFFLALLLIEEETNKLKN